MKNPELILNIMIIIFGLVIMYPFLSWIIFNTPIEQSRLACSGLMGGCVTFYGVLFASVSIYNNKE